MTRLLNILLLLLITSLSFSQTQEEIDNAQGLMNYWQQLVNAGKYNEAIKHTDKLTFYNESHRLYLKGTICNEMKDEESAEKYFSASLKENPLNSDAIWELAIIMYNQAVEMLNATYEVENEVWQREHDAAIYAFKEVIPYLEKSVELDDNPQKIKILASTKALVAKNDKDYAKSLNDLQAKQEETRKSGIITMEKKYAQLYLNLANKEKAAEALCDYANEKDSEWEEDEAYITAGIVLKEKKHYKQARQAYWGARWGKNRATALAGIGYCSGNEALLHYQEKIENIKGKINDKDPCRGYSIKDLINFLDNACFDIEESLELENNDELKALHEILMKQVDYLSAEHKIYLKEQPDVIANLKKNANTYNDGKLVMRKTWSGKTPCNYDHTLIYSHVYSRHGKVVFFEIEFSEGNRYYYFLTDNIGSEGGPSDYYSGKSWGTLDLDYMKEQQYLSGGFNKLKIYDLDGKCISTMINLNSTNKFIFRKDIIANGGVSIAFYDDDHLIGEGVFLALKEGLLLPSAYIKKSSPKVTYLHLEEDEINRGYYHYIYTYDNNGDGYFTSQKTKYANSFMQTLLGNEVKKLGEGLGVPLTYQDNELQQLINNSKKRMGIPIRK